MSYLIKYLILSYSIIVLFPDIPQFGVFWAAMLSITFSVIFLFKPLQSQTSSTFLKIGIILFILLSTSVLFNVGFSLRKIQIIKYIFPLFITGLAINHFNTLDKIISLNRSLKFLSFILMFYLLFSFQRYSFDFTNFIEDTNSALADKPHVISQLYGAIIILFLGTQIVLSKFKKIQLLFLVPLLFTGARSVLLGSIIFTIAMLAPSLSRINLKMLTISILIFVASSIIFLDKLVQSIYTSDSFLMNLFVDKATLLHSKGIADVTAFTGGRDLILNYYIRDWKYEDLLIGNGMQYLNPGSNFVFRLHNDFFEFFFSYGIVALIFMVISIYRLLFWKTVKMYSNNLQTRSFLIAVMFYFIIVSATNSVLDYQSTLYLYMCLGIFQLTGATFGTVNSKSNKAVL